VTTVRIDPPPTVYRKARVPVGTGVAVYSDSEIEDWAGWPEQIVGIVRAWNDAHRLRFVYPHEIFEVFPSCIFRCRGCSRFVDPAGSTACRLDGEVVCDDCVIDRAFRYGILGRPETELEKAKRWQRAAQTKIARYRHNALAERAYVERLREAATRLADEAARACVEPRHFHANEGERQQKLSAAVAGLRSAVRGR
jgi:hypothetical protein